MLVGDVQVGLTSFSGADVSCVNEMIWGTPFQPDLLFLLTVNLSSFLLSTEGLRKIGMS